MRLVYILYLVFVSHGTSATNEYLAAGLYFQLLGCHTARTEQTTDKVELQQLNEQYTTVCLLRTTRIVRTMTSRL